MEEATSKRASSQDHDADDAAVAEPKRRRLLPSATAGNHENDGEQAPNATQSREQTALGEDRHNLAAVEMKVNDSSDHSSSFSSSTGVQETEHAADWSVSAWKAGRGGGLGRSLLEKMGWTPGAGLGLQSQGEVAPVKISERLGRAGLGSEATVLAQEQEWVMRNATVALKPSIISSGISERGAPQAALSDHTGAESAPSSSILSSASTQAAADSSFAPPADWIIEGEESPDEHVPLFCNRQLMDQVFEAKEALDALKDKRRFREARARANPFENISREFFNNRAALKIAELDSYFKLTEIPVLPEENGIFYFADICAGPGGFTEYTYWRLGWRARGWGFTLRGENDFAVHRFNESSCCETFSAFYGPDDDGDITRVVNLRAFSAHVLRYTDGRGLALVMGDGGFNVSNQENRQEWLSKGILAGQFAVALSCLRPGGAFVCKMFDNFTPFTVSCLYYLFCSFREFSIFKPVQSRPANSERYIVCRGFLGREPAVVEHFYRALDRLEHLRKGMPFLLPKDVRRIDVSSLLPLEWLSKSDERHDSHASTQADSSLEEATDGIQIVSSSPSTFHSSSSSASSESKPDTNKDPSLTEKMQTAVVSLSRSSFSDRTRLQRFVNYLQNRNEEICAEQVVALVDLKRYYLDTSLAPPADQESIREEALRQWNIPQVGEFVPKGLMWDMPEAIDQFLRASGLSSSRIFEDLLFHNIRFRSKDIPMIRSILGMLPSSSAASSADAVEGQAPNLPSTSLQDLSLLSHRQKRLVAKEFWLGPFSQGPLVLLVGTFKGTYFVPVDENYRTKGADRIWDPIPGWSLPRGTVMLAQDTTGFLKRDAFSLGSTSSFPPSSSSSLAFSTTVKPLINKSQPSPISSSLGERLTSGSSIFSRVTPASDGYSSSISSSAASRLSSATTSNAPSPVRRDTCRLFLVLDLLIASGDGLIKGKNSLSLPERLAVAGGVISAHRKFVQEGKFGKISDNIAIHVAKIHQGSLEILKRMGSPESPAQNIAADSKAEGSLSSSSSLPLQSSSLASSSSSSCSLAVQNNEAEQQENGKNISNDSKSRENIFDRRAFPGIHTLQLFSVAPDLEAVFSGVWMLPESMPGENQRQHLSSRTCILKEAKHVGMDWGPVALRWHRPHGTIVNLLARREQRGPSRISLHACDHRTINSADVDDIYDLDKKLIPGEVYSFYYARESRRLHLLSADPNPPNVSVSLHEEVSILLHPDAGSISKEEASPEVSLCEFLTAALEGSEVGASSNS